ncbi:MAG: patatin-like phospholipase family protein [Acidimicrobiales bacterium]
MKDSGVKRIDLALQGGGAHGAFTWGVLDRLLDDERIEIDGISGTSAGAMNAVALAQGLAAGGRREAQELLSAFWKKVSDLGRVSPVQRSIFDVLTGRWSLDLSPGFHLFESLTRTFSPYELNPLNINPLRDVVAESFDFDVVNRATRPRLFLSATNVRTGRPKVFRQPSLSVDTTMASACLPFLFQAVEIDGEAYWDGGYTGNPPIFPLIDETEALDIVIVQINPITRSEVPRTAYEITNRLNEITFNASLIKELRAVSLLRRMVDQGPEFQAYRDRRLHMVQCDEKMLELSVSSKLNSEWAFLRYLHDIGRRAAEHWLGQHFDDLGERSSWRPSSLFDESPGPVLPEDDDGC